MTLHPIETAPKNSAKRIILYAPSGYKWMPFRCDVGVWSGNPENPNEGHWLDSSYTRWEEGGDPPTAWSELPEGWEMIVNATD